jgi:hypothetical protein
MKQKVKVGDVVVLIGKGVPWYRTGDAVDLTGYIGVVQFATGKEWQIRIFETPEAGLAGGINCQWLRKNFIVIDHDPDLLIEHGYEPKDIDAPNKYHPIRELIHPKQADDEVACDRLQAARGYFGNDPVMVAVDVSESMVKDRGSALIAQMKRYFWGIERLHQVAFNDGIYPIMHSLRNLYEEDVHHLRDIINVSGGGVSYLQGVVNEALHLGYKNILLFSDAANSHFFFEDFFFEERYKDVKIVFINHEDKIFFGLSDLPSEPSLIEKTSPIEKTIEETIRVNGKDYRYKMDGKANKLQILCGCCGHVVKEMPIL